jgi:quercetin dioxygenase-like cupin family protein
MPSSPDLRAVPTVQIDDDRVRVTEWRFAPDAATGWHRHEYAYVVVPMTTGRLAITGREGTSSAELVRGQSYTRSAGVEHDVRNANAFEFVFVEIELKVYR